MLSSNKYNTEYKNIFGVKSFLPAAAGLKHKIVVLGVVGETFVKNRGI